MDLTEQKYLYYLDPFSLLNTSNLPWAASICVSECPSVEDLCEVTSLPCRNSTQYRCVLQPQSCAMFNPAALIIWTLLNRGRALYQESVVTTCSPYALNLLFCRCPYYCLAPGINGTLADQTFEPDDTEYFGDLSTSSTTTCPAAAVQACSASCFLLTSLKISFIPYQFCGLHSCQNCSCCGIAIC